MYVKVFFQLNDKSELFLKNAIMESLQNTKLVKTWVSGRLVLVPQIKVKIVTDEPYLWVSYFYLVNFVFLRMLDIKFLGFLKD